MVSPYSWQVFVTVAEEKSFVKAARVLNVSQSAVSHIIAKLEEEQGEQGHASLVRISRTAGEPLPGLS